MQKLFLGASSYHRGGDCRPRLSSPQQLDTLHGRHREAPPRSLQGRTCCPAGGVQATDTPHCQPQLQGAIAPGATPFWGSRAQWCKARLFQLNMGWVMLAPRLPTGLAKALWSLHHNSSFSSAQRCFLPFLSWAHPS